MSLRKGEKAEAYHVIHKLPTGDSPYVRAKHLQVPNYITFPFCFSFQSSLVHVKLLFVVHY